MSTYVAIKAWVKCVDHKEWTLLWKKWTLFKVMLLYQIKSPQQFYGTSMISWDEPIEYIFRYFIEF